MPIHDNKVGIRDNSQTLAPGQANLLRLYREHGRINKVAEAMGQKPQNVSKTIGNIIDRLKVYSKQEAVEKATKLGLI